MERSEDRTPKDPSEAPHPSPEEEPSSDEESKSRKKLNVVSVPNDRDMIAQEMAELFEEDQVTHQHGSTEPEGD